jgi:hypothetical protein
VVPAAEQVHTTSTTVMDGPSPTVRRKTKIKEKLLLGGGSIKARTSPTSTSGSPSFENHRRHE